MIQGTHLIKRFDEVTAINDIDITIREGEVFGLVGTNGAGKSTFLRILSGIYRPDGGTVTVDDLPVYENEAVKQRLFFIPDDPYYFPNATPAEMAAYYSRYYPDFDMERFNRSIEHFSLNKDRKIKTFSKGMRRQAALLVGLCSGAKYLLLDETFDGLDPVMRQAAKSLIAENMVDHGMTPVIASHNLRELEDICDHVGILHQGGIILSQDLLELKAGLHRIQCVLREGMQPEDLQGLDLVRCEHRGSVHILTVRGDEGAIRTLMESYAPVFYEIIPLSLEEIFISETEVAGYDIRSLIF